MREGTDSCKDRWWGLWRVEKAENLTKAKAKTNTWPRLDQDQYLTKTKAHDSTKTNTKPWPRHDSIIWPFRCQCWQPDPISQSETCLDGFIEGRGSILKNAGESSVRNDMLDRIQNFWQKIQTIRLKFSVEGHLYIVLDVLEVQWCALGWQQAVFEDNMCVLVFEDQTGSAKNPDISAWLLGRTWEKAICRCWSGEASVLGEETKLKPPPRYWTARAAPFYQYQKDQFHSSRTFSEKFSKKASALGISLIH